MADLQTLVYIHACLLITTAYILWIFLLWRTICKAKDMDKKTEQAVKRRKKQMIYYNGKWLIAPEIKAELDRLNCEIERLERENAVLRASATATEECETE